jgi:hypothetical protein
MSISDRTVRLMNELNDQLGARGFGTFECGTRESIVIPFLVGLIADLHQTVNRLDNEVIDLKTELYNELARKANRPGLNHHENCMCSYCTFTE